MYNKTLVVSRTFGTFAFDAVFNESHSVTANVTEHPLQTGAPISDHAYLNPVEIPISIGMSDAATELGTIAGGSADRSVTAYSKLLQLMASFEPVTLITRLTTYENMLITSIAADDDYTTQHALKATIIFKQIEVAEVSTVSIQSAVSTSKSTSKSSSSSKSKASTQKASSSTTKTANQSVLKQLANKVTGK